MLYTLADSLEELKVETLSGTVAEEEIKGLVNTMAHRLAEVEAETLYRTLVEAEAQVLVETLADRLGFIQVDTLEDTRDEVEAKVLLNTLSASLAGVEVKTLVDRQHLVLQGKAQVEEPFPSGTLGPVASLSLGVSSRLSTGQWLAKHLTARLNWCCLRISSKLVSTT